jgi:hypothetical protein
MFRPVPRRAPMPGIFPPRRMILTWKTRVPLRRSSAAMPASERRSLSWIVTTLGITSVALAALMGFAFFRFGSIHAALSYMAGQGLVVNSASRSFGTLDVGRKRTVVFTLSNTTDRPITVIGSRSTCTCMVAGSIPLTIPPAGKIPLEVTVRAGEKTGDIAETLHLFTDYAQTPLVRLQITGRVCEPPRLGNTAATTNGKDAS